MPTIRRTVTTTLPISTVFTYLSDFSNAVDWDPGTTSSSARNGDEPAVGTVYDLVVKFGTRTLPMTYEITDIDTNKRVVLDGEGSTTRATDTMTFSPTADDGTVVSYEAEIHLKGLLRLAEPFLGKKFKELGDEAERGLTTALTRLEARPPDPQ
jgi:carbon monoxide dehydrogenase subunit G